MMLRILALCLLCAGFLVGCANVTAPTTSPALVEVTHGWKPVGLKLPAADSVKGGIDRIATAGVWVLAKSGVGNLFLGKEGQGAWVQIDNPSGESFASILGMDSVFYCGSDVRGGIWIFHPQSQTWSKQSTPEWDSTSVYVMTAWNNQIVAFMSKSYVYWRPVVFLDRATGQWQEHHAYWPSGDGVISAIGLDTVLVAGTFESGLFRWNQHDTAWRPMKNPQDQSPSWGLIDAEFPRAFAWTGGRIWVGERAFGLYNSIALDSPWVSLEGALPRMPIDVYALLSWRGKLFVGGYYPSTPIVHDPVAGTWKYVKDNFCYDKYGSEDICDYRTTWKFAATEDTLYAAAGGTVLKIGWGDIP